MREEISVNARGVLPPTRVSAGGGEIGLNDRTVFRQHKFSRENLREILFLHRASGEMSVNDGNKSPPTRVSAGGGEIGLNDRTVFRQHKFSRENLREMVFYIG